LLFENHPETNCVDPELSDREDNTAEVVRRANYLARKQGGENTTIPPERVGLAEGRRKVRTKLLNGTKTVMLDLRFLQARLPAGIIAANLLRTRLVIPVFAW
jgi:hypothetical protein